MCSHTFLLCLGSFDVSVSVGFDSRENAELVRSCVDGRVSGARLPPLTWALNETVAPDVRLEVEDLGDDLMVRFRGVVQTPRYRVDKVGFHWDFGKVITALVLPEILKKGVVALHAATVAWPGSCVLLPGSSGSGKSSVTYAAMALGADVRASELSFVRDSSLVAGNSSLTIDDAALARFGIPRPPRAHELDRRVVVDLPDHGEDAPFTRLVFPRVGLGGFSVRPITARRARMLLYENAVSQLPMSHLLAHETHPVGIVPSREELAVIAEQISLLSERNPAILEGPPQDIARYMAEEG